MSDDELALPEGCFMRSDKNETVVRRKRFERDQQLEIIGYIGVERAVGRPAVYVVKALNGPRDRRESGTQVPMPSMFGTHHAAKVRLAEIIRERYSCSG